VPFTIGSEEVTKLRLHSFFRSSATWRVRIALALKAIPFETIAHNFRLKAQRDSAYLALNPLGVVPSLESDDFVLNQSLAIIEYLDEIVPEPALLPLGAEKRAVVRSMAQLIACDIHPINNLRILTYLKTVMNQEEGAVDTWYRYWVSEGFQALEQMVVKYGDGCHCFGEAVTLADLCLIPQLYNARRFKTDLGHFPTLIAIETHLGALPAFVQTIPECQADAV
jgi:maleylacetoacetate isomerase